MPAGGAATTGISGDGSLCTALSVYPCQIRGRPVPGYLYASILLCHAIGRMLHQPQPMNFHIIIEERPGGRRDPQGPNSSNEAPARLSRLSLAGASSIQPGSLRRGAAAKPPVTIPGL